MIITSQYIAVIYEKLYKKKKDKTSLDCNQRVTVDINNISFNMIKISKHPTYHIFVHLI